MDVLYIYKHSANDDFEIRHSLRSIAQHAPYIRKVWIYGDKPKFISDDTSLIQHVPEAATTPLLGAKTPVSNFFLLMFLSSLIPDLFFEYLLCADDYFLLKDCPDETARKIRCIEDMSKAPIRGHGIWIDTLWRTYDQLIQLGYTGYNFETHTPAYLQRKWVRDAYFAFKDYVAQTRWEGMTGPTAVLNHAYKTEQFPLTNVIEEKTRCGFWGAPPSYEEVIRQSEGRTFFNFDDDAFGDGIRRFLAERFPKPCRYEKNP
jgi:hypothetical protein